MELGSAVSLVITTAAIAATIAAFAKLVHAGFNPGYTANWPKGAWIGSEGGNVPAHKLRNKPELKVVNSPPPLSTKRYGGEPPQAA